MSQYDVNKPSQNPLKKSRAVGVASGSLALAISSALVAGVATAQEEKEVELDKVTVEESVTPDTNPYAVPGAPYLADRVSDPRRTRSVAETPQTITVLTGVQLRESGRSDLRDILDGQPGITLGTGENGNAFGDRYIIRGHEARSDMFVDGLRDPGMTIRESFAVEQVEISKGPSSSFAGRGTTGGAVNSATKRASTEYDFSKVSAGVGTDAHHRLSLDVNKALSYDTAIRANILHSQEDVPNRSPADRKRIGAALSVTHKPTDKLEITADYYHFQGDDKPDLGTYIQDGKVVEKTPVYLQDEDFLESQVDTGTLRLGYELNPQTRIVNLLRYGTTDNGYMATGTRGTTAYATEADAVAETNGYASAGMSTHQGWQEVEYFANQLNLITNKEMAGMNHELVFGLEYSDQSVLNGAYTNEATGAANCFTAGRGGVGESYCIYDANGNIVSNLNSVMQKDISKGDWDSDWNIKTVALSAMDTVDLTDKWTAFGGVRYDYYDYKMLAFGRGSTEATEYANTDGIWNGHVGASYKINPKANVYASFSTATNINGGESDVGSNCGYGGICSADGATDLGKPEQTISMELGTKWRLSNDKLLASASVFSISKDDVMEVARDFDYTTTGNLNTGKNEVTGIEFGLAGNITSKLSVQLGLTMMNAEITESISEDNVGKTLANFADNSASVHMRYQATPKFAFGGTATYESERFTGQPDSAANEEMPVPEYTILDAFASYNVNRDLSVRLNIGNVLNEEYYLAAYRSGSFTYIGDKRNTQLTLEYSF